MVGHPVASASIAGYHGSRLSYYLRTMKPTWRGHPMRRLALLALALLMVLPALARAQQSKKVMDLVADLRSKNPKVRQAAAQEIGNLADIKLSLAQSALPNLKTSQRDPDPGV